MTRDGVRDVYIVVWEPEPGRRQRLRYTNRRLAEKERRARGAGPLGHEREYWNGRRWLMRGWG